MILATMPSHPNRSKRQAGPMPREILEARQAAGLTQAQAAELIYSSPRAWQNWEMPADTIEHRRMPAGLFELFRFKVEYPDLFKVRETCPAVYIALLEGKKAR